AHPRVRGHTPRRRGRLRALAAAAGLLALLLAPAPAPAQGNFEIQVYGSELTAPGQTMLELHSNTAVTGTTRTEHRIVRTQGAAHETLEVTHGFTPWFEPGFYLFTSVQPRARALGQGRELGPRFRVHAGRQGLVRRHPARRRRPRVLRRHRADRPDRSAA